MLKLTSRSSARASSTECARPDAAIIPLAIAAAAACRQALIRTAVSALGPIGEFGMLMIAVAPCTKRETALTDCRINAHSALHASKIRRRFRDSAGPP